MCLSLWVGGWVRACVGGWCPRQKCLAFRTTPHLQATYLAGIGGIRGNPPRRREVCAKFERPTIPYTILSHTFHQAGPNTGRSNGCEQILHLQHSELREELSDLHPERTDKTRRTDRPRWFVRIKEYPCRIGGRSESGPLNSRGRVRTQKCRSHLYIIYMIQSWYIYVEHLYTSIICLHLRQLDHIPDLGGPSLKTGTSAESWFKRTW